MGDSLICMNIKKATVALAWCVMGTWEIEDEVEVERVMSCKELYR